MSEKQPQEPFLRGCGPLILVALLMLMSPYLAFCNSSRTRVHRQDAEQFYATRIDGQLRLPSERQIRAVTEKRDFMGDGYFTVRFTLPPSRSPRAWLNEIRRLNSSRNLRDSVSYEPRSNEFLARFSD